MHLERARGSRLRVDDHGLTKYRRTNNGKGIGPVDTTAGSVTQVLYNRVTGQSREVTILPPGRTDVGRRMTFSLHANQRAQLEALCAQIRRKTGAKVSSSMVVRGVLDALADTKLDLSGCVPRQRL